MCQSACAAAPPPPPAVALGCIGRVHSAFSANVWRRPQAGERTRGPPHQRQPPCAQVAPLQGPEKDLLEGRASCTAALPGRPRRQQRPLFLRAAEPGESGARAHCSVANLGAAAGKVAAHSLGAAGVWLCHHVQKKMLHHPQAAVGGCKIYFLFFSA
jgi:hypothetical protein